MWEKIKKFFKWIADHTGISWIARKISSGWKWLFGGKANTTQQNTSQHEERSDNEKQEPAQSKGHTTPKTPAPSRPTPTAEPEGLETPGGDSSVTPLPYEPLKTTTQEPAQPTLDEKSQKSVVNKRKEDEFKLNTDLNGINLSSKQALVVQGYKSRNVNTNKLFTELLIYIKCGKNEYRVVGRAFGEPISIFSVPIMSIVKKNENGEYLDSNVKNHVNKDVQEMLGLKDDVTKIKVDSISNEPFKAPTLEQPDLNTTTTQQVVNNDSNREIAAEEHASSSTTTGLTEQLPEVNSTQELSTPNNEPVKIDTSDQPKSPAVPDKSQEPVVNPPKTEEKGKPNNAASNGEVQPEVSNKEVAAEEHAPNLNKNVDSKGGLGSEVSDNEGFEDDIEQPKSLEVQEDEVVNDMQNQGQSQNSNGMADPLAKPDQGSGDEPNQSSFDNESVKDDDKEADNPQPEISAFGEPISIFSVPIMSIVKKNENGEYLDSNVKNHVNKDVQEMLGLKDDVTKIKVDSISNEPFKAPTLEQPDLNTTTTQQVVNNDSNREIAAEEHASSSTTTGLTEQLPEVNSTQELSTPNNEPVKIDTSDQPKSPAVPDKSQEPVVNPPKTEEKGKPNNAASNGEVQPEVSNKEVAAEEHAPNLNKNVDSKGGLGSEVSDNEGFEDDIEQPKSLEVQEDEVVNDMQNQGQSQNSNGMADPLAKPDQGSGDEPNQSSFDNESVKDDDKEADNPQPEISAFGEPISIFSVPIMSIVKKNENGEYLDSNVKNHVNKDVQEMLGLKDDVTKIKVDSISNEPFKAPTLEQPDLNTTTTQQVVNNDSNREIAAEEHASSSTTTGLTEQLPEVNSTQELSTPNNEPVKIDTSDQPKSPAVPDKSQEPVVNPPKTEEKGKPNNAASNGEVQPEVSNKEVAAEEHAPNLNKNVDSKGGLGSEVSDNEGFEDDIEQPKSLEVQEDEVVNDMQNQGQSQNSNGMADPLAKPDQGSGDEPNQSSFDNESVKDDDKEADNPQPEISANGSAPTDSSSFDIVSSQATTPDELQEPDEDKELARQSEANQKAPANDDGPNSLVAKPEAQTASNDLSHKSQSL